MRFRRLITGVALLSLLLIPSTLAVGVEFEDAFTETGFSDVILTSHTPSPTGTSWTKLFETGASDMEVNWSNDDAEGASTCSLNEGVAYIANPALTSADAYVEITMTQGDSVDDYNWIGLRIADANNGYWLRFNSAANTAQIYKRVASTWSTVGSAAAATIADGSVVKFEIVGSALKVYDDGVQIISTTDTDLSAAGNAGMGLGDLTNNDSDDCATSRLDNFKVTTTAAGTPAAPPVYVPEENDWWN